jgi:endonuclease/exonuclease/phosphatase family metal-dependent hydrolase
MGVHVRMVTWNLHGPPLAWRQAERFAAVAARILHPPSPGAAELPDFVLFQEVWFPSKAQLLTEAMSPAYEAANVDGQAGLFPGRKGGLLSFVRRDRGWHLQASSFQEFRSEAPPWRFWEGDGIGDKGFQVLHVGRDGRGLLLINTHLQAEYGNLRYADIRRRQVEQIEARLRDVADQIPVLIAGDFNTRPDEPLYTQMTRPWIDLTEELRAQCGCGTTVPDGHNSEWIDYVLTRRSPAWRARVEHIERIVSEGLDTPYSDHQALDVSVVLEPLTTDIAAALAIKALHGPSTRRAWLAALSYLALGRAFQRFG